MADRPDFLSGFWHNLGPTANDRLTDIWENAPLPGETVKVTVGPMTHLTWTLVCVIAQGMIFKRNSLDGVVYLAKQEAQFRWYNVAFRTRAEAEVTSLSGDVLAVIPVFPLMHWEELRSHFAELLQITKWEVRLVYGLQFIGQRNITSLSHQWCSVRTSTPSCNRLLLWPSQKPKQSHSRSLSHMQRLRLRQKQRFKFDVLQQYNTALLPLDVQLLLPEAADWL